ncbi:hypothetical protein ABH992_000478 [Bradyrhizobium yuanmingense]|uniref:Uncharacterized protein n=1 Tax=Bradyrhizobium yuanmingense TaxID=108015 RepID=A0ABV4G851_9BRAD
MVIDDVEIDHDVEGMRRAQQPLEILRPAIAGIRRVQEHAVIAPIVPPGDVVERHQLDGGDAEIAKIRQLLLDAGIGPLLAERADMQLVDHGFRPGTARIEHRVPQRGRIDHLARRADVVRLEARGGIGHDEVLVDPELIARAGARSLAQ